MSKPAGPKVFPGKSRHVCPNCISVPLRGDGTVIEASGPDRELVTFIWYTCEECGLQVTCVVTPEGTDYVMPDCYGPCRRKERS